MGIARDIVDCLGGLCVCIDTNLVCPFFFKEALL